MLPLWKPPSLRLSYVIRRVSPAAVLRKSSYGRMGTLLPPGTTALKARPSTPPQYSSLLMNSSQLMPSSISYTPGPLMFPPALMSLVPVLRPTPILAYSSPPMFTMGPTVAMVSTLLTTAVHSDRPFPAGTGGQVRGIASVASQHPNEDANATAA